MCKNGFSVHILNHSFLFIHVILITHYIIGSQSYFHFDPKLKLMDQVKKVLRYHHYAYCTEQIYCQWILRYIRFFDKTHLQNLNSKDIKRFLSHLALKELSPSTQRQALNALVFLYCDVLDIPLENKI